MRSLHGVVLALPTCPSGGCNQPHEDLERRKGLTERASVAGGIFIAVLPCVPNLFPNAVAFLGLKCPPAKTLLLSRLSLQQTVGRGRQCRGFLDLQGSSQETLGWTGNQVASATSRGNLPLKLVLAACILQRGCVRHAVAVQNAQSALDR